MLSRAVLSLMKSNKSSIIARRGIHDTIYVSGPPKTYSSYGVS